jgi:hypothetical protein
MQQRQAWCCPAVQRSCVQLHQCQLAALLYQEHDPASSGRHMRLCWCWCCVYSLASSYLSDMSDSFASCADTDKQQPLSANQQRSLVRAPSSLQQGVHLPGYHCQQLPDLQPSCKLDATRSSGASLRPVAGQPCAQGATGPPAG